MNEQYFGPYFITCVAQRILSSVLKRLMLRGFVSYRQQHSSPTPVLSDTFQVSQRSQLSLCAACILVCSARPDVIYAQAFDGIIPVDVHCRSKVDLSSATCYQDAINSAGMQTAFSPPFWGGGGSTGELSTLRQMMKVRNQPGLKPQMQSIPQGCRFSDVNSTQRHRKECLRCARRCFFRCPSRSTQITVFFSLRARARRHRRPPLVQAGWRVTVMKAKGIVFYYYLACVLK